jgi:aarF domain-containing kinase
LCNGEREKKSRKRGNNFEKILTFLFAFFNIRFFRCHVVLFQKKESQKWIHFLKSQQIYFIIKVVVFAQKMRSFGTTPTTNEKNENRKNESFKNHPFFMERRRRRSDDDFAKKHHPKSRLCFDLSENNNTKNKNNNSASSPPPPPFPSPQMPLSSPVDGSGNDGGDFVPVLIPSLSLSSSSSSANGDGDGVGTTPTRTTAASSSSSSSQTATSSQVVSLQAGGGNAKKRKLHSPHKRILAFSRFRREKLKEAMAMYRGNEGDRMLSFLVQTIDHVARETGKLLRLSPAKMVFVFFRQCGKVSVHAIACAFARCWMGRYAYEGARVMVFALAMVKMRDAEDIQQALTGAGKRIKKKMSPSSLKKAGQRKRKAAAGAGKGTSSNGSISSKRGGGSGVPFLPSLKSISHVVANAHKSLQPMCVDLAVTHAQVLAVRLVLKLVAPRKKRSIEYSLRVAPVMTSYILLKQKHKLLYADKPGKRALSWDQQHEWGAEQMTEIIADFGGFYRKVGQIAGTASQMMPRPYVEKFSKTMDDNPPTPFYIVRKILETELGGPLGSHFSELSRNACATASIAQVHFGRLLDGREVAVKVQTANYENVIADLKALLRTARTMKKLRLDNGMDLPTIFEAYLDVIDEEFNFKIEHEKIDYFGKLFEQTPEICDKVCAPRVVASTRKVLVMRRVRGAKLLTIFNRARQNGKRPRCPQQVSRTHSYYGGDGWNGVFFSIFRAWGEMMLTCGHFHSDPHPGNFILRGDGKLCILDWGQTKRVDDKERLHMCRLALRMSTEDYNGIASEVRAHGSVLVEKPTNEALVALSYAYFDTRPSALAEMNMLDLENSPFTKNKITQNTREGFFAIRGVFLLRGMLATCGEQMSMVEHWQDVAIANLRDAGEWYPGRFRRITTRIVNKAALQTQRTFNFGSGAKMNEVEAYAQERKSKETSSSKPAYTSFSSLW